MTAHSAPGALGCPRWKKDSLLHVVFHDLGLGLDGIDARVDRIAVGSVLK